MTAITNTNGQQLSSVKAFKDTEEAAFRRRIRHTIRLSNKVQFRQKAVLEYLVNLWFVHRNDAGFIHPGVEKIAKKVKVSADTVSRALKAFKSMLLIKAIAFAKGGRKATRYQVDLGRIEVELVNGETPAIAEGELIEFTHDHAPSSPGPASAEIVNTTAKCSTVKSTAHCDRLAHSGDHHPAFMPIGWLDQVLAMMECDDYSGIIPANSSALAKGELAA